MVYPRGKCKFWGLEGVVGGEVDVEEEHSALEGRVGGAEDGGLPVERVVPHLHEAQLHHHITTPHLHHDHHKTHHTTLPASSPGQHCIAPEDR